MTTTFDFSRALGVIKSGGIVTRQCWEGTGLTIGVVVPEPANGVANPMLPFLAIRGPDGTLMPWSPSSQEMFANDWVELSQVAGHG